MAIPLFLAMTGAEMGESPVFSSKIAWMACHFSPYSTGLSNLPGTLPEGSMLILNDRTPVCGHDPGLVTEQLAGLVEKLKCGAVLLDFQRPGVPETAAIAKAAGSLPCPVGVTEYYAEGLACPVFLPPVPPHIPLGDYLSPWQGREVWLEAALDGTQITVTAEGTTYTPLAAPVPAQIRHQDTELHCHYDIAVEKEQIRFQLYRTAEDLADLLAAAENIGVTRAVGLYQELGVTEYFCNSKAPGNGA